MHKFNLEGGLVMGFLQELFKKKTEDWVFSILNPNQVPEEPRSNDELIFDEVYLSITLRSMRIVNVRHLTKKFYGVVHSYAMLNHLSGSDAIFQTVTTPTELKKVDPKHLDRVVFANLPLLGPVPYRGGKVTLELGLFSVAEADLAAPFIDLLETIGKQAGVSVLTTAMPFVQPLKKGIDAIVGTSDDSILEIGLSTNFDPPKTGWFVVIRAPKDNTVVSGLMVTENDFKLVDSKTGNSIKDYPYMVFSIAQSKQRNDWYKLPYLDQTYKALNEAVRKGDYEEAQKLITVFEREAILSDDLITTDAKRIATLVQDKANTVIKRAATLERSQTLPPLETYPLYV